MVRRLTAKVRASAHGASAVAALVLAGCSPRLPPPAELPPVVQVPPAPPAPPPPLPTAVPETPAPAKPPGIDLEAMLPQVPAEPNVPEQYPSGIVPQALLDNRDNLPDPARPPLSHAEPCAARLKADPTATLSGCAWTPPAIAAFHPTQGKVAFLVAAPTDDARSDCRRFSAVVTSLARPEASEVTPLSTSKGPCGEPPTTAPWGPSELLARLAKEGYQAPLPLVKGHAGAQYAVWGYRPLAVLRAPLRGYLLYASEHAGAARIDVDLIGTDNKTRHRLGSTPLRTPVCVEYGASGKCTRKTASRMPTVLDAALSPDRKYLVVLLELNTLAPHDTESTLVRSVFPMPVDLPPAAP